MSSIFNRICLFLTAFNSKYLFFNLFSILADLFTCDWAIFFSVLLFNLLNFILACIYNLLFIFFTNLLRPWIHSRFHCCIWLGNWSDLWGRKVNVLGRRGSFFRKSDGVLGGKGRGCIWRNWEKKGRGIVFVIELFNFNKGFLLRFRFHWSPIMKLLIIKGRANYKH